MDLTMVPPHPLYSFKQTLMFYHNDMKIPTVDMVEAGSMFLII